MTVSTLFQKHFHHEWDGIKFKYTECQYKMLMARGFNNKTSLSVSAWLQSQATNKEFEAEKSTSKLDSPVLQLFIHTYVC